MAKGGVGGHPIETLWLVKGLGRGKGILWQKQSRNMDPAWVEWWINSLQVIISILEERLTAIVGGDEIESVESVPALESVTASVEDRALVPTLLEARAELRRTQELVRPQKTELRPSQELVKPHLRLHLSGVPIGAPEVVVPRIREA